MRFAAGLPAEAVCSTRVGGIEESPRSGRMSSPDRVGGLSAAAGKLNVTGDKMYGPNRQESLRVGSVPGGDSWDMRRSPTVRRGAQTIARSPPLSACADRESTVGPIYWFLPCRRDLRLP